MFIGRRMHQSEGVNETFNINNIAFSSQHHGKTRFAIEKTFATSAAVHVARREKRMEVAEWNNGNDLTEFVNSKSINPDRDRTFPCLANACPTSIDQSTQLERSCTEKAKR